MGVCVNCGKEADGCLCDSCKNTVNIEELCDRIIGYKIDSNENPLWEQLASELNSKYNFRNVVCDLVENLPSPKKEYWKVMALTGTNQNIAKESRPWLYRIYAEIKDKEGLSELEMNRVRGLVLGALYMDYRYQEAEQIADKLPMEKSVPWQAYCNLADFYSKTRRYDEADDVVEAAVKTFGRESVMAKFAKVVEQNNKYRNAESMGKRQYIPQGDEAQKAYYEFLDCIGIEYKIPTASGVSKRNIPEPIPKDQYPPLKETRDPGFDSFVAYDLETTGLAAYDEIIQIGAVKVENGKITALSDLFYQENVKPFKKRLSQEISELTGITREDLKAARPIWEIFPDFMKFVGDSVMVGFNNICFDSRFLERAGRYAHITVDNLQFDTMKYSESFREKLGITDSKISLELMSNRLGIDNPQAHNALADAVTTARVFLKLKEMDTSEKTVEVDDMLSDLDNW